MIAKKANDRKKGGGGVSPTPLPESASVIYLCCIIYLFMSCCVGDRGSLNANFLGKLLIIHSKIKEILFAFYHVFQGINEN